MIIGWQGTDDGAVEEIGWGDDENTEAGVTDVEDDTWEGNRGKSTIRLRLGAVAWGEGKVRRRRMRRKVGKVEEEVDEIAGEKSFE